MGREARRDKTLREVHREHERSDPRYHLSRAFRFGLTHPWIGWLYFTARALASVRVHLDPQRKADRLYFIQVAFYD